MTKKIRVGILFGGKSSEHEVSLASAQAVLRALDREKYEPVLIGVTRDGRWLTGGNPLEQLSNAVRSPLLKSTNGSDEADKDSAGAPNGAMVVHSAAQVTTEHMLEGAVDVVFPLIHGPNGEDGTVQGLLELADLPYVGSGVAASAVGMDKALMKSVFRAAGLPQANYVVVFRSQWDSQPERTIRQLESVVGYPCFVKPANLGSSVGVTKAHNWDELAQGLATAALYDRKLIVEQAIDGREIECSVLGNDDPVASVPGEVIPHREFYDYQAKYADEETALIVPADLTPEQCWMIQELAVRAFKAIDACGMARVDFFLERGDGRVIVNEINTIPGFTSVSMYPRMWQASGLTFSQLINRLIELALERHADKKRNTFG